MPDPVWFWQRIISPHMAGLAAALADGGREVIYLAEEEMSTRPAAQGWRPHALGRAHLRVTPNLEAVRKAVSQAAEQSIHICQGLRGNGLVGVAQRALAGRGWTTPACAAGSSSSNTAACSGWASAGGADLRLLRNG